MKDKTNQLDQTSDWREKLRQMQDVSFNLFQFNGTYDDSWQEDFISTLLKEAKAEERKRLREKIVNSDISLWEEEDKNYILDLLK